MFSAIRRRATYANVAMTLALVFAMTGGAYAAKKYLITSTKQISPSVLKALVGKAGPAGVQGPAGSAGPVGSQGSAGEKGASGAPGQDGKEGPAGKQGVTGASGSTGATGPKGPAGVTGAAGATGKSGLTGFTETLPKGKTETGSWSFPIGVPALGGGTAISFAIPLASEIAFENVIYVPQGEKPTTGGCAGGTSEKPLAEEGFLCVYNGVGEIESGIFPVQPDSPGPVGVSTTGTVLVNVSETKLKENEFNFFVGGTWAVTAP